MRPDPAARVTAPAAAVQHPAIAIKGVWHSYGARVALADVSLDIARGEIFALLGPNRASVLGERSVIQEREKQQHHTLRRAALAVLTLWWREITRFRRQRSRWSSALLQPLLFWVLLGGGLQASFRPVDTPAGTGYMEYFYPGVLTLVMLFTAIFATIAVVEDRREGFLQGVLVAPVSRTSIVLGQALGSTTLALLQGVLFLFLAPFLGIALHVTSLVLIVVVLFAIAFSMTNLGLIIAWRLRSTQGFHAVMNLLLMPLWLLSGAFFPMAGAPVWLQWVMRINPLTYGMAALRRSLYLTHSAAAGAVPALLPALTVILLFGVLTLLAAVQTARHSAL